MNESAMRAIIPAIVVLLASAACGTADSTTAGPDLDPDDGGVTILTSTDIWADLVGDIACEPGVAVDSIIPGGADPHGFETSLADRARLDASTAVVVNGHGLEESLLDTVDAVAEAGVPVVAAAELPEARADRTTDEGTDPHVWLDPTRVAGIVGAVGLHLSQGSEPPLADPSDCVTSLTAELEALDRELAVILEAVPPEGRKLVTNHDALGYFADRYGYEIVGTVLPADSTLAETNPRDLEELLRTLREQGVPAIFVEQGASTPDADAVAAEVGIATVEVPVGSLGSDPDYASYMRRIASIIAGALT